MKPFVLLTVLTAVMSMGRAALADQPKANCDAPQAASTTSSAERGRAVLLEQVHLEPVWPREAYENAWKQWGIEDKPDDYDTAFRERYGLHPVPYENDGLPMGLRRFERDGQAMIAIDCMLCHGGSIAGNSYVGLPNTTLDLPLLYRELTLASGLKPVPLPFPLARTRGTINSTASTALLLSLRNPDLSVRFPPVPVEDWGIFPDMDVPPWWHWKRKQSLYADGSTSAESTRSIMVAMTASLAASAEQIKAAEPEWTDMASYIRTLQPPQYPFPIDDQQAAAGEVIFRKTCARCHGTYGPEGRYPNKVVPIDVIGTDRARYETNTPEGREYYNAMWFGEKHPVLETAGYQAPPLDGIWASAPYFHNGSVPTVSHVLNSKARPERFRRAPSTEADAYDREKLGWRVEVLDESPPADLPPIEGRRIFDTTQFGKGNGGHPFGDHLTEEQRAQVIEYLKTL